MRRTAESLFDLTWAVTAVVGFGLWTFGIHRALGEDLMAVGAGCETLVYIRHRWRQFREWRRGRLQRMTTGP